MTLLDTLHHAVFMPQIWMISIISICLWIYVHKPRYNLPPRPYSYPVIGNLLQVYKHRHHLYTWLQDISREYGAVFRLSLGFEDAVFLNDITSVQQAMAGSDIAGRPRRPLFDTISDGGFDVIISDGSEPKWKAFKKLLITAMKKFTSSRYYELRVNESVQDTMNRLEEYAERGIAFDPEDECRQFGISLLSNMCFQKRYKLNDAEFTYLHLTATEIVGDTFEKQFTLSDIVPLVKYLPFDLPDIKKLKIAIEKFNEIMNRLASMSKQRQQNNGEIEDLCGFILKVREEDENENDMREITDRDLIHLFIDLFGAGGETIQTSIR